MAKARSLGPHTRSRLYLSQVWAIILCHFCHNWGLFILLTWMPAYYSQVLGLSLMQSGGLSVLPWVAMTIMSNVAGWAADAMVARGVSVTNVRKVSPGTLPSCNTGPAAAKNMFLKSLRDASFVRVLRGLHLLKRFRDCLSFLPSFRS